MFNRRKEPLTKKELRKVNFMLLKWKLKKLFFKEYREVR